ncbi:MAG: AMP-binding protein [Syntrophomonadales bacterium]|jgi:long-chain acyl-CoA synthetase
MASIYESCFWLKSYNWKTPASINYPKNPAYYILRDAAVYHPKKAATWFYGAEITFYEQYQMVCHLANVFVERGIKKGDRIGILMPNCPQFTITYWATLMAGAIVVNLNPLYTAEELKFLFADADMSGLVTYDPLVPVIKELNKEAGISTVIVTKLSDFMPNVPVSTPEELGLEAGWLHFSQVLETDQRWMPPVVDIEYDDPAVIQYTGGTTGIPKGAVLTQYNITAAAMNVVLWTKDMMDRTPIDAKYVLSILPFSHVYGEVCCICYGAFNTTTQVILPRFEIDEVFDTIEKFDKFVYWPAVPTMIQALFYHPRMKEIDWHDKFIYTGSGAAPAPVELINKCRQNDFNFFEGYGMSETAALALSTPFGRLKPRSVGVPFIDMVVRIVDEDGNDVPLGQPGEIWMKGPYVMKEYWRKPEETANAFSEDGWLKSGDIAYMDEEGYVFIVDRTKDMIIAGGFNIYPRDVDEVLLKHPKVADAMTIGVPDEYRGETVKAFIQLKPGVESATAEEMIAHCREHLTAYKVPRLIEFRSEPLPRTNTGKALRRILRDEEIAKMKETNK